MKTAEQLRAAIAASEQQIEALRQAVEADKAKLREIEQEWPKLGKEYWFLASDKVEREGLVKLDPFDKARSLRGNVMRTREEAEAADRVRIAVTAINRAIDAGNKAEGWVADWGDSDQRKYAPAYDYGIKSWFFDSWKMTQRLSQIHFGSESVIVSILKTHAAELDVVRKGGVE